MTEFAEKLLVLKVKYAAQVKKALVHLDYSYKKSLDLPMLEKEMDEETLEAWEGFSSRFLRVVDIYTTKYLKTCVLLSDPAFDGSYRDLLDQTEKLKLIESADFFMKMREIRNIHAHDYREDKLILFLTDLKQYAPELLKINL
ncbi:MAG: hypothetical protein AABY53_06295 [Bdellovibrionota bacterium]